MIVADTSVFIDYFNGIYNRETGILKTHLRNDIVVLGDIVALELIQGIRSNKDKKLIMIFFDRLIKREMLGVNQAIKYAEFYRTLRAKGFTIRKTADTIIAGYCIINNLPLLQRDRDFKPFEKEFGLSLL